jgi:glycosyltransferase involved in cell wall biosynthesis
LIRDREKWQRFSRAARQRAIEHFPTEDIVARYRAVYERTLGERREA